MRFLLPLVALCALSSAPLKADEFAITLTGNPGSVSGSGTFTTDGSCMFCRPDLGMLSLTIDIGANTGMDAFDISDDPVITVYNRPANTLDYIGTNSETGEELEMGSFFSTWDLQDTGGIIASGTYSVTPTPEPRSLFLLMPIVALIGLHLRHQRRRA